jgi:hypothetical protein
MADICMSPMTKVPTQTKEDMPKTTTINHTSVLEMALVGYEIQRNRIEAAIAEIRAELGQGDSSRSIYTASDNSEPKATRKKRFSVAARKRMAAAQRKRWQVLKAKKATPKKTKPTVTPKRRKVADAPTAKKRPVQAKEAKKVARKVVKTTPQPKAKASAPKAQRIAAKVPMLPVETAVATVQAPAEPAPATE